MNTIPRLLLMMLLVLIQTSSSQAELGTIMSAGIGQGESITQGDYVQRIQNSVFSMGFDYDYQGGLFLARGISSIKNDFKQLDLIWGYGNKYIKLGTGFTSLQSSIPTNPYYLFDTSGQNATNGKKRIDLSVTTIPLYLRFKPIASDNFTLTIDGYYGLHSVGSMTFPFFQTRTGQYTTVSSEPKRQGGSQGYAIAATWRLAHPMLAICLQWHHREAVMLKQISGIDNDTLGMLDTVTTPEMTFRNRALLLKVVLVK